MRIKNLKNRKNSTLLSLFFVVFLDVLGVGLIIPVIPVIFYTEKFFSGSNSSFTINLLLGLLIAAYPLAQFFAAPVLGRYSDRYGRKKILLLSLAGSFIGYLIFALGILTVNVYLLFLSRIIDGLTGGNIAVVNSSIADVSNDGDKTKNFGLVGMAFGIGFIFGPFMGGLLSDSSIVPWFGVEVPFLVAALLVLLNIVLITVFLKESIRTRNSKPVSLLTSVSNIKKVVKLKKLNLLFLTIFIGNFGWAFFTQFVQVFLYDKFSYSTSQIGYIFAYMGVWIVLSQGAIIRPVSSRYSPYRILKVAMPVVSLTLLSLLLPAKHSILYLIVPALSISYGFVSPNFSTIMSNLASKAEQGEVLGLMQSVTSLSQAVPPILAGMSLTISTSLPVVISSLMIFISWLVFIFFCKNNGAR